MIEMWKENTGVRKETKIRVAEQQRTMIQDK